MTLSTSSSNIKDFPDSQSIWKKPIRVGPVVVVPIHESLVKKLQIDEQRTWFEEIPTEIPEGIFLKKQTTKKIPSRDLTENPRDGTIGEQHSDVIPSLIQKLLEKVPT